MLTVLSPLAVQMLLEKGCQAHAFTESTWPRSVCLHRNEDKSQSRVVWSMLQDAKKSPVWWNAQSQTACVWSEKVWAQAAPAGERRVTVAVAATGSVH